MRHHHHQGRHSLLGMHQNVRHRKKNLHGRHTHTKGPGRVQRTATTFRVPRRVAFPGDSATGAMLLCVEAVQNFSNVCDLPVPVRNESTLGKVTMPVIDTGVAAWNCFCMDSNLASFCWQKLGAGVGKPTLLKAQEEKVDNIPGGGHRGGSLLSRPPSKSTRSALIFHLSESQWRGGAGIRMQGALGPLLAWGWRGP